MRNFHFFAAFIAATFALAFAASCGADDGANPRTDSETTMASTEEERMLEVRRIDSGSLGQGDAEPRAFVASSSESLSAATGIPIRGGESTGASSGEETYVAVLWGQKNTGGYSVEIGESRIESERVSITVVRENPPEGAIVSQALTYPYAVAAIENLDPENKTFSITDEDGNELEWQIEAVE